MQQTLRLPAPILILVACSWLAGILLSACLNLLFLPLFLASALIALLLLIFWPQLTARLMLLLTLALLCGAWRYAQITPNNDPQNIAHWIGPSPVEIQGIVSDEPRIQGRLRVLHITASQIRSKGTFHWYNATGELTLQTLGISIEDPYSANYGDSVTVSGKLQPPIPNSPVTIVASISFPKVSINQLANTPLAALFHFRLFLANNIERSLPQPEAALLIAILLSLRTPALKPLIASFNITGTAHLIAPSGFKVTILAGIITKLLSPILTEAQTEPNRKRLPAERRGGWRAYCMTFLIILSVFLYTALSGFGPAALRSGIMGTILVISPRLGRQYNMYTALAFTALAMTVYDPQIPWDFGFQLSFCGTLGIIVLTPIFQNLFRPLHLERILFGEIALELFAVTLAAQVGSLPFFISDFQQFSLIAPLTNLLTVPLLMPFIVLGSLLCIASLLFAPAAQLLGWLLHPLLWYCSRIILLCAQIPYASIPISHSDNLFSLIYYSFLSSLLYTIRKKWPAWLIIDHLSDTFKIPPNTLHILQASSALLILLATGSNVLAAHLSSQLSLTFLSVGPVGKPPVGSSILIRTPDGKTMLIDGGLDTSSLAQSLDSLLPSWQRSLDLVLLSTPRADHLNALLDTLQRYTIGTVLDPGMLHPSTTYARWRRTIDEKGIRYFAAQQGMQFFLGNEVTIQVLWPGSFLHKGTNESRDNALVVRILTPSLRLLLLGVAAESPYATQNLLSSLDTRYMQAEVVQVEGEESAPFAPLLPRLLAQTHATQLIETPGTQRSRRANSLSSLPTSLPCSLPDCQILQTRQTGSLEITDTTHGMTLSQIEGG